MHDMIQMLTQEIANGIQLRDRLQHYVEGKGATKGVLMLHLASSLAANEIPQLPALTVEEASMLEQVLGPGIPLDLAEVPADLFPSLSVLLLYFKDIVQATIDHHMLELQKAAAGDTTRADPGQ
jgi:hypothetical protein